MGMYATAMLLVRSAVRLSQLCAICRSGKTTSNSFCAAMTCVANGMRDRVIVAIVRFHVAPDA